MEKNFQTKVNLKTWVKVKEDWQESDAIVKRFKINWKKSNLLSIKNVLEKE